MSDQRRFTVSLSRSADEVFDFVVNPANTPRWIDSVAFEQVDEWPARVGTKYRSRDHAGEWAELSVVAFERGRIFELAGQGGQVVTYTLRELPGGACELEYVERDDDGSFTPETLMTLKSVLEGSG
jgi:uncharacterized protein YndB with AHSA1/START domain